MPQIYLWLWHVNKLLIITFAYTFKSIQLNYQTKRISALSFATQLLLVLTSNIHHRITSTSSQVFIAQSTINDYRADRSTLGAGMKIA